MLRRGLTSARAWLLGVALGLPAAGCFEDIQDPPVGTEGSTGTSSGSTTGTDVDPDSTAAVEPDSGAHDGGVECPPTDVCVDLAPDGWEGPVAYFEGASPSELPSCGAPFGSLALELYDQLTAPPAECGTCGCGDPTNVECSSPAVRFYGDSKCFVMAGAEFQLGGEDECIVFPEAMGVYGAEADPVTPLPGTGGCTPSGDETTLPEVTWGTALRACAPPDPVTACGDGQVCVPVAGEPFAPGLCIYQPGNVPCPSSQYGQRFVRHATVEDGRGCSECQCGEPGGSTCQAEILLSHTNGCTDDYVHIVGPGLGSCVSLSGEAPGSGMLLVLGVSGGDCSPFGGEPQGEAVPAEPVTFCCSG